MLDEVDVIFHFLLIAFRFLKPQWRISQLKKKPKAKKEFLKLQGRIRISDSWKVYELS